MEAKVILRADLRKRKVPNRKVQALAGRVIWEELRNHPAYQKTENVCAFVGRRDEPDTTPLLLGALAGGKRLFLPRIAGGGTLEFVEVVDLKSLQLDAAGFPAPVGRVTKPPPGTLVVVPGQAFDRAGNRLGRGSGHYDRWLAGRDSSGSVIGVTLRDRVIDVVPTEPHDRPVDHLIAG